MEVGEARLVAAGLIAPPAQPGVYAFRDAGDRLLYVGSSRDLGRSVRSYFASGWRPASKEGRIARHAVRVAWQPCGSHLEALVLVTAWLAGREGRAATIDVTRRGPAAAWAAVVARVSPGPLFAPDEALRWTVRRGSA